MIDSVKITNFNTQGNEIEIDEFYNFYPNKKLKPTFSITPALFPNYVNGDKLKEVNSENITIKGVSSFKQFSPHYKTTDYKLLVMAMMKNFMLINFLPEFMVCIGCMI